MAFELVVTDLSSRNRAFPTEWEEIKVTRRLGGYSEAEFTLGIYDKYASQILIGQRAVKFYRRPEASDGSVSRTLRHYGTIWEPLKVGSKGISVVTRDPYAYYPWRRVRAQTTYTGADAGGVVTARVAAQNALGSTFLRMGTVQTSVNRTVSYLPGKREDEIIEELGGMSSGYFFIVNPVDGEPGVFGKLDINYPNAGVTREECRFEYGDNTAKNLDDYEITYSMPKNRQVAASAGSSGGRIASPFEDTGSQAVYSILEDETAVSDITDVNVLNAFAQSEVRPNPPQQYTLTPNRNCPLLFDAFDVGDFCRFIVKDASPNAAPGDPLAVDLYTWVRVVEATLVSQKNGPEYMDSITVESLIGGKPYPRPEDQFRHWLDEQRRLAEMLQRRVQILNVPVTAPASTGGGSAPPPAPAPPPDIQDPPPPPPPAPTDPPADAMSQTIAYWDVQPSPQVDIAAIVNPKGQTTMAWFEIRQGNVNGTLTLTPQRNMGAGTDLTFLKETVKNLARNTSYYVRVHAINDSGETPSNNTQGDQDGWFKFTTPNVQAQ